MEGDVSTLLQDGRGEGASMLRVSAAICIFGPTQYMALDLSEGGTQQTLASVLQFRRDGSI